MRPSSMVRVRRLNRPVSPAVAGGTNGETIWGPIDNAPGKIHSHTNVED